MKYLGEMVLSFATKYSSLLCLSRYQSQKLIKMSGLGLGQMSAFQSCKHEDNVAFQSCKNEDNVVSDTQGSSCSLPTQ